MHINLKKLKATEIRKLAKTYNKLNSIPHPSTLKKSDLILYLKERLETNNKGYINLDLLHPKLKKVIQPGIDRLKQQFEESKKELEKTIRDIKEDIEKNKKQEKPFVPYRDTLTKKEREEQDKRVKYLIETGKILTETIETPKTKKEIKELEAREKAVKKLLEKEAKEKADARSKFNQEAMKKAKLPTKKKVKVEKVKEENIDEDDELTPEQKKMQAYFASIVDPKQRMKEVKEYVIKQREAIKKQVEAKEAKEKPKKLNTLKAQKLLKELQIRNKDRDERSKLKTRLQTSSKLTKQQKQLFDMFEKIFVVNKKVKKLETEIEKLEMKYGKSDKEDDKIEKQIEDIKDKINDPESYLGGPAIPDLVLSLSQISNLIKSNLNIYGIALINNLLFNDEDIKLNAKLIEDIRELVIANKELLEMVIQDYGLNVLFSSGEIFDEENFEDEDTQEDAEIFQDDFDRIAQENKRV
jgi:chemotaxis protein histidine kinase CheA